MDVVHGSNALAPSWTVRNWQDMGWKASKSKKLLIWPFRGDRVGQFLIIWLYFLHCYFRFGSVIRELDHLFLSVLIICNRPFPNLIRKKIHKNEISIYFKKEKQGSFCILIKNYEVVNDSHNFFIFLKNFIYNPRSFITLTIKYSNFKKYQFRDSSFNFFQFQSFIRIFRKILSKFSKSFFFFFF